MKWFLMGVAAAGVLVGNVRPASAQAFCYRRAQAELTDQSSGRMRTRDAGDVRGRIREFRSRSEEGPAADRAFAVCVAAELSKQLGDPMAESYYQAALRLDPRNPEYAWLYGDYLRNYRGPGQPLADRAKASYLTASDAAGAEHGDCEHDERVCLIERSLISLYERDGLPLDGGLSGGPSAFLSSRVVAARRTAAVGTFDDVRAFTSEAQFASSRQRLGRELTGDERSALVVSKPQYEIANRLRFRIGRLPAIDLLQDRTATGEAQITDFFDPTTRQKVTVDQVGLGIEKVFGAYPFGDVVVRAEAQRVERQGLIEFLPEARESGTLLIARMAASRFIGRDRLNLDLTFATERLTQKIDSPIDRGFTIVAPTARWEIFRGGAFRRRIARRGSEVFAGAAVVDERFGDVLSHRRDLFGGIRLRGLPGVRSTQSFDISIQPTLFSAHRSGSEADGTAAEPLRNAQLRAFATVLYRLVDRENEPDVRRIGSIVFVNAVVAASHDTRRSGPEDFLSRSLGFGLDVKLVVRGLGEGTTLLLSGRIDLQRYPALGRTEHAFETSLSMGF